MIQIIIDQQIHTIEDLYKLFSKKMNVDYDYISNLDAFIETLKDPYMITEQIHVIHNTIPDFGVATIQYLDIMDEVDLYWKVAYNENEKMVQVTYSGSLPEKVTAMLNQYYLQTANIKQTYFAKEIFLERNKNSKNVLRIYAQISGITSWCWYAFETENDKMRIRVISLGDNWILYSKNEPFHPVSLDNEIVVIQINGSGRLSVNKIVELSSPLFQATSLNSYRNVENFEVKTLKHRI